MKIEELVGSLQTYEYFPTPSQESKRDDLQSN
jgi:hypothetical protein